MTVLASTLEGLGTLFGVYFRPMLMWTGWDSPTNMGIILDLLLMFDIHSETAQ